MMLVISGGSSYGRVKVVFVDKIEKFEVHLQQIEVDVPYYSDCGCG